MIKVVNGFKHSRTVDDYYIGQPSPLANPFTSPNTPDHIRANSREDAVKKYKVWIKEKLQEKDPDVTREIKKLVLKAEKGDLNLSCWCAPQACHGDVLKIVIESIIKKRAAKKKKKGR